MSNLGIVYQGTDVNESMVDITDPSMKSQVQICETQSTTPITTFNLGNSDISMVRVLLRHKLCNIDERSICFC